MLRKSSELRRERAPDRAGQEFCSKPVRFEVLVTSPSRDRGIGGAGQSLQASPHPQQGARDESHVSKGPAGRAALSLKVPDCPPDSSGWNGNHLLSGNH